MSSFQLIKITSSSDWSRSFASLSGLMKMSVTICRDSRKFCSVDNSSVITWPRLPFTCGAGEESVTAKKEKKYFGFYFRLRWVQQCKAVDSTQLERVSPNWPLLGLNCGFHKASHLNRNNEMTNNKLCRKLKKIYKIYKIYKIHKIYKFIKIIKIKKCWSSIVLGFFIRAPNNDAQTSQLFACS